MQVCGFANGRLRSRPSLTALAGAVLQENYREEWISGGDVRAKTAFDLVNEAALMEISRPGTHGDRHVFEFRYQDVNDSALILYATMGNESVGGASDLVKTFPHVGFDDEIDLAGLVF